MAITRPASTRLLKIKYTHRPRALTSDGQGGRKDPTFSDGSTARGTKRAIYTEQFASLDGERFADKGLYILWVQAGLAWTVEDQIRDESDSIVFEIKRTDKQNGLVRLVIVEAK